MMDVDSSFQQAREWLAQGLIAEAKEMLFSVRRQLESESAPPPQMLQLWRGLLAIGQYLNDGQLVQEMVPKLLQLGRDLLEFDSQAMGSLLHEAGKALACAGAGADAETFFMQAYRRLPQEPRVKFDYALRLTYFYATYGHPEHALRWAKDAVLKSASLPEADRILAQRAVASLTDHLGKSMDALGLRQAALNALTSVNPAYLMLDQARSQRRLGWASKAEPLYREALRLLPEKERPRLYRELALCQLSRRDLAGAESTLREGMQNCESVSFAHQLMRAEQARLWQYQGRFAEADTALQEILALWSERFQPHHPLCLRLREVQAELCILRRDFRAALARSQELLKTASEAYGCEHPSVARALYWMAQTWTYEGEREKARQALAQARAIWDSWEDVSDAERAQLHFALGLLRADELEFYLAEEELRKACDLVEQQGMGSEAALLGYIMGGLSEIHRITGRDRQSQEAAQRSQELLRPRR